MPGLVVGGTPVGDEVAHDFVEDALAPVGVVELGLGNAQERVAHRKGIEDAGVQDGGERHGAESFAGPQRTIWLRACC